jgi:hypothetical protein
MSPRAGRDCSGAFMPQDRGNGARRAPHEINIFLRGTKLAAPLVDLGIEWHPDPVLMTFMSGQKVANVGAAGAIVFEPSNHLYESLQLISMMPTAAVFGVYARLRSAISPSNSFPWTRQ